MIQSSSYKHETTVNQYSVYLTTSLALIAVIAIESVSDAVTSLIQRPFQLDKRAF